MVVLLTSCASTGYFGDQLDGRYCFRQLKRRVCTADPIPTAEAEKVAKQFETLTNQSTIWIVRNAMFDTYGKVTVKVLDQDIVTFPYTSARVVVPPGSVHLVASVGSREIAALTILGNARDQLFVNVYADFGLPRNQYSLRIIPDSDGRRKAVAGKLIKDITIGAAASR
jgi:hypothetical protein